MRWTVRKINKAVVQQLSGVYKLVKPILILLSNRGYHDKKSIASLVYLSYNQLYSPWLFETMESAVKLIEKYRHRHILIYGDHDVDGITATAFLVKVLSSLGYLVSYYIPDRSYEEHGLTCEFIDTLQTTDVGLIITVDTGINSYEEIAYAQERGIDIIVTDHHRIVSNQCTCLLMINPKVSERYPFKELSGVGVAFKLAQGLYEYHQRDVQELYQYMELVMLGTVADVVSIESENRLFVKKGLEQLSKTSNKGLRYLLCYLKLNHKVLAPSDVSFYIAPLLNALGRMGKSMRAVAFFLEENETELYQIIEEMKEANHKRRRVEKHTYDEIVEGKEFERFKNERYLFLQSYYWNPGILGVIASKLVSKIGKPVILISVRQGFAKASCRSVEGINIFDILSQMKEEFIRFGGHNLAAGFVCEAKKIPIIEEKIAKLFENCYSKSVEEELLIDMELPFKELTPLFMRQLGKILPFPYGHKPPLLMAKEVYIDNIHYFGQKRQHFTATVKQGSYLFSATGFNLGEQLQKSSGENSFDILYTPEQMEKASTTQIHIKIKDI